MPSAVSFVVPVLNGISSIRETIESIRAQDDGRPTEIIVVDDGSDDGSLDLLERMAIRFGLRLIRSEGRGAAAAVNAGIRAARYPIVCQVDQDVVLETGWMRHLTAELADPSVGGVQGYFVTDPRAPLLARVMGLDLEERYSAIDRETDHVCTGNAAYRTEALHQVGLFDETLGYGYDNDMSYRLRAAGYRLRHCQAARSLHRWRAGLSGYLRQQYGFGYGRIDLVAKHPDRVAGDRVSPAVMMLHPLALMVALVLAASVPVLGKLDVSWASCAEVSIVILASLMLERLLAGWRATRRFRDPAGLAFPVVHFLRDIAWVAAMINWSIRRIGGCQPQPSHSMRPRPARTRQLPADADRLVESSAHSTRLIAIIPAHNEAANLASVVADLKARRPDLHVLVVDDGSTDSTAEVLDNLGVRWIRLPERMGVGCAMRAGLRYALRLGFDSAVRLDGDGQHGASDLETLLEPIQSGQAEVVLGSRYAAANSGRDLIYRFVRHPLAVCLTALTGRRITDPTSGFCAFGPRAVRLLADHHPSGYAEPELRLFLSRNGLRVVEVSVRQRARLNGRTSLTALRLLQAGARVMLAMLIVPLRPVVEEPARD